MQPFGLQIIFKIMYYCYEAKLHISVLTSAEFAICLSYSYNKLKLKQMKTNVSHWIYNEP